MEIAVFYTFFALAGIGFAKGTSVFLRHSSVQRHSRILLSGIIWVLTILYLSNSPNLLPGNDASDLGQWLLTVSVPWTICALGVPMVLPQLWAAIKAGFNEGAIQWFVTIIVATSSYFVFVLSQSFADSVIQNYAQTHPDQFPGAQRVLTAVFAFNLWIVTLFVILFSFFAFIPIITFRSPMSSITSLTAFFALIFIPLTAISAFKEAIPTDEKGQRIGLDNLVEYIILKTSFIPNKIVEGVSWDEMGQLVQQTRLACRNLPPEAYVAFVHPDEVVPDKVVAAEPRGRDLAVRAPTYNYRLSTCDNSNNPDDVK